MLHYCKKCGRLVQRYTNEDKPCDYCNNSLHIVPIEFTAMKLGTVLADELKEQFVNEYIKSSPEFDQYLFDHRDQDLYNKRVSDQSKIEHGKAIIEDKSRVPKCPTCQSTNIRKMSGLETGTSIAVFGLFSRKINKTFKCNQCGYTW